jgi:hypothetical protein
MDRRLKAMSAIVDMLTLDQREAWNAMIGKEFDFGSAGATHTQVP